MKMNKLEIKGFKNIDGMNFHDIEGGFGNNKKAMLVKDIAQIHERDLGKVNELINNNRKRFVDDIDIIDLKANPFEGLGYENAGYTKQSFNQSKNVYLLSERGYSKLLKILEDDVAWEQYEKLVDGYFNMRAKEKKLNTNNLSPELQMFNKMFQAVANLELSNKELKKEVQAIKQSNQETNEKLEGIREITGLSSVSWKADSKNLIVKIAHKLGGNEFIQNVYKEIYSNLERRASCQLSIRRTNKQKKMALEGVCKSKIDAVNKLDIIGEDKKILECFLAIVKKLAIKYGV